MPVTYRFEGETISTAIVFLGRSLISDLQAATDSVEPSDCDRLAIPGSTSNFIDVVSSGRRRRRAGHLRLHRENMDSHTATEQDTPSKRFIPADLADKFALADPHKAKQVVRDVLADYPEPIPPVAIEYFANRLRTLELRAITTGLDECTLLRKASDRGARSLANAIQFQLIAIPPASSPFDHEMQFPNEVVLLYQWAAAQLHDYGRQQSFALAELANKIVKWCRISRVHRIDIVDSPIGATLPATVLAQVLKRNGIEATMHEFLAPRLDKHGKRHSIKQAARTFCNALPKGSHPVL